MKKESRLRGISAEIMEALEEYSRINGLLPKGQ
jgi:hypothetical protein